MFSGTRIGYYLMVDEKKRRSMRIPILKQLTVRYIVQIINSNTTYKILLYTESSNSN